MTVATYGSTQAGSSSRLGPRKTVAGLVAACLLTLSACSSLDDTIAASSTSESNDTASATTSLDGSAARTSTTDETLTVSESTVDAEPTTETTTPPATATTEPPTTTTAPAPGIEANASSRVACTGAFLLYGVTAQFELAVCDIDGTAVLQRLKPTTNDFIETPMCLSDDEWIGTFSNWTYRIDTSTAAPELVIINPGGYVVVRESFDEHALMRDAWADTYDCP